MTEHNAPAFEPYVGLEGLERLAPDWQRLVAEMPEIRFNHYPEWYRAYLRALEPNVHRVVFIAVYRARRLVAVCPLHFQYYRRGAFRPRMLGTIEHDQMQLSDFVFTPSAENATLLDDLTGWLRTESDLVWDELRLRRVSEESSLSFAARSRLPKATLVMKQGGSAHFRTDGSYAQSTRALTAKFRSNLRRRYRLAEKSAALRHEVCTRADELDRAFATFLDIEASGWKGEVGTSSAIRCQPPLLGFYGALRSEFGARGACLISLLWHGEEPVAGQFCLVVGRTLNILKVGFSERHALFAPGLLLLDRMIAHACEHPDIDVLHLVNEPQWARFFRPATTGVWSYCAPNWSARGMLIHLGLLAKRKLLAGSDASSVGEIEGDASLRPG